MLAAAPGSRFRGLYRTLAGGLLNPVRHFLVAAVSLLALPTLAHAARDLQNFDAAALRGPAARRALPAGNGAVVSRAADGTPTFVWGTGAAPALRDVEKADAASVALQHVRRRAALYGLGPQALAAAEVRNVHDTGRGAIVVLLGQRISGLEVVGARMAVVMNRELGLVAIAGALFPSPDGSLRDLAASFPSSPSDALGVALSDLYGSAPEDSTWTRKGDDEAGAQLFGREDASALVAGPVLGAPARVWPVLYPLGGELVPAYRLEIFASDVASTDGDAYRYIVGAADGRLLRRLDLTANDSFAYTVWADPGGLKTPLEGPAGDYTPHPAGLPDGSSPSFVAPVPVSIESFNNPVGGGPDPWLDAAAVETSGNNVDAYADLASPDGFSAGDLRASTTGPKTFGHLYDTGESPNFDSTQTQAAVVNLFYVTNWLHDYFYDSGFDEAAGNAQNDNYGRGGAGSDALNVEAEDYSGRNNANMSTPADGAPPRMQMYVWDGLNNSLLTRTVPGPETTYAHGSADNDPADFDVTADLVLAADTGGVSTTDLCEANGVPLTGKIVLVDRGNCSYTTKATNAAAASAAGLVLANNAAGAPPSMAATSSIPMQSVSQSDGAALKALLAGTVTMTMSDPPRVDRSGTLDGGLVAHEWGHFFHHRLQECGTWQCGAMSEGWGDFLALHLVADANDDLGGTFGVCTYAPIRYGEAPYFGIRRYAYSVDPDRNALRFRHISDGQALPVGTPANPNASPNSEVHNAGEIWASMLWDAYVALQEQVSPGHTFEEARRLMADYMVAGLQATPVDATFTETRDGLLAVALANEPADAFSLAQGFAARGAGTCAGSPPRYSSDLTGVVEDYSVSARIVLDGPTGDDGLDSCDDDGLLDTGERGTLAIEIANVGPAELTDATLSFAVSNPALVLDTNGLLVPPLSMGQSWVASLPVRINSPFAAVAEPITVTVEATSALTCGEPTVVAVANVWVNLDLVPASADDVEAPASSWTEEGDLAGVWSRIEDPADAANRVWLGVDADAPSDTWLLSAPIQVAASGDFVVDFWHRFQFEQDGPTYYDGGVVEVSTNDGASWDDVSTWVSPGYPGTVNGDSGNVLQGRPAYVGTSGSWPDREAVSLEFGTALQGQTVRLRFRIGTDPAAGAYGWEIDDLAVSGSVNEPFLAIGPDACDADLFSDGFETGTAPWSAAVGVDP